MTPLLKTKTQELEWALEMPDEIAEVVGVPSGSIVMLHASLGNLSAEILPPPAPEDQQIAEEIWIRNKELFAELKRLGD